MIYIIGMACMTGTLSAQTVVDYSTFEQKVLDYSQTLKQSVAQRTAMQKAMKAAKTAFFPAVDATGSYQYRINKYEMDLGGMAVPMEHDSYSAEVGVSQPIYAGGSIYHNYKASQIQTQMADKSVDLTTDNIIYAAEASYWGTAAQKEMYETMCQYVQIIEQLTKVLQDKYDDGYISKTDLIQMQTRLKEAELQRSSSYQSYQVALQNMNVLMGLEPLAEMDLTDSISTILPMPAFIGAETALNVRPDYAISQLDVDYQKRQVSLAAAKYNPSLSIGFKETWGTQMLNISGETMFNSNVYASIKLPIFHWGARFKSTAAQKAILLSKQYALQDKQDQISKEVAKAWTSLTENTRQISIAEENCKLAEENLDLNTFSYTEGKLTILDVLSAQLTWIQAYTNLIQSYYEQKIALADYRKATGIRDLAAKGYEAAQIKEILERTKYESSIYITLTTLKYLKKGGRITPAAAALGTLLRIKPVLTIQGEKLDAFSKARTAKQAKTIMLTALAKDLEERFHDKNAEHTYLEIAHTCNEEGAKELEEALKEQYPGVPITIAPLSLSIACHIGPGSFAVACSSKLKELE